MARLQDFQDVNATSSDKLLIVQVAGQGLSTLANIASKIFSWKSSSDLPFTAGSNTSTKDAIDGKAEKSALTWTLAGEATGTNEVAMPSDWNEAQVYGMFGGNANYGFCAHIIKAHLGANPTKFIQGGADKEGGTDHHIAIWHCGSNNKIGLELWRYNNTSYISTAKIIVYYR